MYFTNYGFVFCFLFLKMPKFEQSCICFQFLLYHLNIFISQADPWSPPPSSTSVSSPPVVDPWAPVQAKKLQSATSQPKPPPPPAADPWKPASPVTKRSTVDPWSPCRSMDQSSPHLSSPSDLDEFDIITNRDKLPMNNGSNAINNNGQLSQSLHSN